MLEVQAHQQLKHLLRADAGQWEHQLTLSRLVGRSLRRRDQTSIQLSAGSDERWWLALLVPLCLQSRNTVLVLDPQQRQRFLSLERPRLLRSDLRLGCWSSVHPPTSDQLWLLTPSQLITAYRLGHLRHDDHLVIPEAEHLATRLRDAMAVQLEARHWEELRTAFPATGQGLLDLHERLSRQLFARGSGKCRQLSMPDSALTSIRDLLQLTGQAPEPWCQLTTMAMDTWASWARLDHEHLQWQWTLQPLEPLEEIQGLFSTRPWTLIHGDGGCRRSSNPTPPDRDDPVIRIDLREPPRSEPIPIYAPRRQPLPNTEIYASHLLDQCRRLILGRSGLTVVLANDTALLQRLASELAAEFGSRVTLDRACDKPNGVICTSWSWWMTHQPTLPEPDQLITALLPIASLEDPLTAARVKVLKKQGRDWFRDLLLPEALAILIPAIAPLRRSGGRLAILDGRVRSRSWGEQVFQALEPWSSLQRLRPD